MAEPLTPWTEARVEIIVHLWVVARAPASDIAKILGGTSRSAVLGKLKRLGKLGKRRAPGVRPPVEQRRIPASRPKRKERPLPGFRKFPQPSAPRPTAVPIFISAPDKPLIRSLLDLRNGHCRWPFGEPRRPDFGAALIAITTNGWHGNAPPIGEAGTRYWGPGAPSCGIARA